MTGRNRPQSSIEPGLKKGWRPFINLPVSARFSKEKRYPTRPLARRLHPITKNGRPCGFKSLIRIHELYPLKPFKLLELGKGTSSRDCDLIR